MPWKHVWWKCWNRIKLGLLGHVQQWQKRVSPGWGWIFLILSCRLSSLSQARLLSGRQALWVQNNTASPNMQLWVKDPLAVCCLHISMPKGWKSQGHHRHRYLMLAATTEGTMTPLCYKGMWQGTALSCVQDDSNLVPPFVSAYSSRVFFSGSLKDKRMSFWAAQSFVDFFSLLLFWNICLCLGL